MTDSSPVEPWDRLKGQSPSALRKLARILMVEVSEDAEQVRPFGQVGGVVGEELLLCADWLEGRRQKQAKKATRPPKPEHEWEVEALDHFTALCRAHVGVPAVIQWGADRRFMRQLGRNGHSPEYIKEIMGVFFAHKDQSYLFRGGKVKDFFYNFTRLCDLHQPAPTRTAPPVGVRPASL